MSIWHSVDLVSIPRNDKKSVGLNLVLKFSRIATAFSLRYPVSLVINDTDLGFYKL